MGLERVAVVLGIALVAAGAAGPGAAREHGEPGAILFSRGGNEDDQCGTIWSVDPEGGDPRQLDVGPGENCDPDWSPDGKHVAFSSNRGGKRLRIYIADSSGRNPVAITQPGAGDDFIPAWSPDGARIVFERRAPTHDRFNLFIVDADGAHERQLTHGHSFDGTPWWSPDGRIVFVSDRTHQRRGCRECSALYVMRPGDGRVGRITRRRFNALMPAWSPDGVHIVWARAPSIDAELALYMMRSDTSAVRRLDTEGESPAWSPDSHTIVYASGGGLTLIGVDGSGRRRLAGTDGGSSPSWRPVSAGS